MFRYKHISLMLLWAVGLVMIIYLSVPLFRNKKTNVVETGGFNNFEGSHNTLEAYVFVTIDKKHFLTRFISYIPSEANTPMLNVSTGRTRQMDASVNRILTKIKPATGVRKTEDFTIKPAPLE